MDGTRLRRLAGGLSVAAGLIHGGLIEDHLEEWWGYGVFFLLAAMAQGMYGVALLLQDVWKEDDGPNRPRKPGVRWYAVGIAGNVGVIALYIVTRTVGIPLFGPAAGETEPVTPVGIVSKALEVALVVVLARLLLRAKSGQIA